MQLGHGEGYIYPHDHPGGVVAQQYFPDGVEPQVLFHPGERDEVASRRNKPAET